MIDDLLATDENEDNDDTVIISSVIKNIVVSNMD
jgi:hypothetical protein